MKGIQCCGDCAGYDRTNKKCGYAPIESIIEEHFYKDCPLPDVAEVKSGHWFLLDECLNEGVYCSVCSKKVYGTMYANQTIKSKYCPNCGARMEEDKNVL